MCRATVVGPCYSSGMTPDGGIPDLSVVPAEVAAVGKYAYDLAGVLHAALVSAGREVDILTKGSWRSTASDSFAKGWFECQDSGQKIFAALTTMASTLGATAKSYDAQDNQFAGEVSSLDLPPIG